MTFDKLLAVRLREMWLSAAQNGMSSEECTMMQKRALDQFAAIWARALQLPGQDDFVGSTLHEIGRWRGINDLAIVRRRCENALRSLKLRWERTVQEVDARHVEKYYDAADDCIEELMWWHTLADDDSPLAYVAALEFASLAGCETYLDFGSGVGSGALLFCSHGFDVTLADISGVMLSFCKYRFETRGRDSSFVNLKHSRLPATAFDFITAMDVFEHLVDPVETVDLLQHCLKPGGYVYGRFASEADRDRPQHIVQDFQPVFDRFAELGFKEVFRDDWLWGHQVFQKNEHA
ncbi:MAG: class I SAM-dependent methyltransferase [Candidatus Binataceae bacterium]